MPDRVTYAVHTDACTYLLDEDGICRSVLAAGGSAPDDAASAIGAQFVACLDEGEKRGLVADLRQGASLLLVRESEGRHVLMRTTPIRRIDEHVGAAAELDRTTVRLPPRPPAPRRDDETTLTLVKPKLRPAASLPLPSFAPEPTIRGAPGTGTKTDSRRRRS